MTALVPSQTPQRIDAALRRRGWKAVVIPMQPAAPAQPVLWTLPGTDHVVTWEEAVDLALGDAPMSGAPAKPGWKTTEFWSLMAGMALAADTAQLAVAGNGAKDLLAVGAKTLPHPWNVIVASLCSILTVALPIAYRAAREYAKQQAAKQLPPAGK